MTTINETVQTSLTAAGRGEYLGYAEPVITALVNREQEIVGNLLTFAQNSDLDPEAVRATLAEAGLHMPPAPQVAENTQAPTAEGDVASALGRIEQALTGLTEFARRNGYNG